MSARRSSGPFHRLRAFARSRRRAAPRAICSRADRRRIGSGRLEPCASSRQDGVQTSLHRLCKFGLAPFGGLVSIETDFIRPEIVRQPGLQLELTKEFSGVGRSGPDLWQKSPAMSPPFEREPIDMWSDLTQDLIF